MGESCFYGQDSTRPDPPFSRTKISNTYLKDALTLRVNNIPVPAQDRRKYRLFPPDRAVGEYPFTWHHNVPWNLLRSSWDVVVTFCGTDCVTRLFAFYVAEHPKQREGAELLKKILKLKAAAAPTEANLNDKTLAEWVTAVDDQMQAATAKDIVFSDTDRDDLRLILCWGAWNLNEGPGVRVDDPGELFDDFGSFDARTDLAPRYVAVARLNVTLLAMMEEYNRLANTKGTYAATGGKWTNALKETLDVCEALTPAQREIVYFDPMMWAPVTPSGRGLEQEFPKSYEMSSGLVLVERGGVPCYIQMKKKVRPGSLG